MTKNQTHFFKIRIKMGVFRNVRFRKVFMKILPKFSFCHIIVGILSVITVRKNVKNIENILFLQKKIAMASEIGRNFFWHKKSSCRNIFSSDCYFNLTAYLVRRKLVNASIKSNSKLLCYIFRFFKHKS